MAFKKRPINDPTKRNVGCHSCRTKKELVIGKISLPEKLDVGQVLVEYHFSGICGSQIGEIEGIKGADIGYLIF